MARQVLPTNFKDDVLSDSMDGKRRYILTENADGTFSLEDATTYIQVGDVLGAARLNAICKAVNESVDQAKVVDDIDDIKAITQSGYVPGTLPLKQVISDLDGCSLERRADGVYITYTPPGGADPVSRKLGEPTVIASELNSSGARTVDCTAIIGYQNLTVDNFLIESTGLKSGVGSSNPFGVSGSLTKTYDSETGVLTVGKCVGKYYDYSGNNYGCSVLYNVLLV